MITVRAPAQIRGEVDIPGSKSISNRILVLKTLTGETLQVKNLSDSQDTQIMLKAIADMRAGNNKIHCGDAGTCGRFLIALCSVVPGEWEITGSPVLGNRPFVPLIESLRSIGADIQYQLHDNLFPVKIRGGKLVGNEVTINGSQSSQFISALMLVAPVLKNGLVINISGTMVSKPYVEMTAQVLRDFGHTVKWDNHKILITGTKSSPPTQYTIESDWSSASYFFGFVALLPGSTLTLKTFREHSIQGDSIVARLFESLGVRCRYSNNELIISNSGDAKVGEFYADCTHFPDLAQTLAVTCAALGVRCELTGLSTLVHKETNRISALETELTGFGAGVQTGKDWLTLSAGRISPVNHVGKTYHDHRMALSLSLLSSVGPIALDNAAVVSKSYPLWWEHLKSLGFELNLRP